MQAPPDDNKMNKPTRYCCRICANEADNRAFHAREMMFGWKDNFQYFECADCGCVQIAVIPENLGKYYPADYYAYGKPGHSGIPTVSRWRKARNRALLAERGSLVGRIAALLRPPGYFSWFRGLGLKLDSRILDVGCGAGSLLLRMRRAGFSHLMGVDPYISEDIDYGGSLAIRKAEISELPERFDLVMSHHSFEHMPNPRDALSKLAGLLHPHGALLIRIPVAGGYAWRKYRNHWVSLDPPRHLHLHTPRSMVILAASCGLRIERVFYDSDAQQIVSSEMYLRDIPLREAAQAMDSVFSREELTWIGTFAKELNARRDGDFAGFVLRPVVTP